MQVVLTLPLPPRETNRGKGWRKAWRMQQAWMRDAELRIQHQVGWPDVPWEKARVSCAFFLWSKMDVDNLMARQKRIIDLLKCQQRRKVAGKLEVVMSKGWYMDDTDEYLEMTVPTQSIDRQNPRVEVTLERVE